MRVLTEDLGLRITGEPADRTRVEVGAGSAGNPVDVVADRGVPPSWSLAAPSTTSPSGCPVPPARSCDAGVGPNGATR